MTRFERNWQHLRDILGIMRPIKKTPGAVLKSKYAEGTLQGGAVGEGEEIPYSKFTVKEKTYAEMTIEKYAKAVSIEAIKDHGYENAVQMTDDEFLFQLQSDVTERFYTYLNTGTLTGTETTFQMALAMAKGMVEFWMYTSTWGLLKSLCRISLVSSISKISWDSIQSSCCQTRKLQEEK